MEKGSYSLTADDLVAADRLYSKRAFDWRRVTIIMTGVIAAWFMWLWLFYPWVGTEVYALVAACLVGVLCVIWFVGWLLIAPMARRKWKRFREAWVEHQVCCQPEEVEFKWDQGEVRYKWTDFRNWASDGRILLLYRARDDFIAVPMAAFRPGAGDAIIGMLVTAGVKER
jgi:hypothetical protein